MAGNGFWVRVNDLMKKNKVTQKQAAIAIGVKPRTFQNWMHKDLYPTIIGGYNLACFLNVSVEYLVIGKEGESKEQTEKPQGLLKKAGEILMEING
jgi:transcriptional regulator with XRE-family HTH domain